MEEVARTLSTPRAIPRPCLLPSALSPVPYCVPVALAPPCAVVRVALWSSSGLLRRVEEWDVPFSC